ncbi:hypothetical protein QNI16_14735 [Cytophagaceae bacterium YF14B1]|uniref:Uncharacterized protein n=1 Tax=Xanthocytophaga flava TaxID=3048013 RepID=A0AAE3U6E4_9BACT|nr:hypothetical protein [Xanthocytophaga flavus]MDJ1481754.1 hypothetical protein [Xanthocytophaga flavus]
MINIRTVCTEEEEKNYFNSFRRRIGEEFHKKVQRDIKYIINDECFNIGQLIESILHIETYLLNYSGLGPIERSEIDCLEKWEPSMWRYEPRTTNDGNVVNSPKKIRTAEDVKHIQCLRKFYYSEIVFNIIEFYFYPIFNLVLNSLSDDNERILFLERKINSLKERRLTQTSIVEHYKAFEVEQTKYEAFLDARIRKYNVEILLSSNKKTQKRINNPNLRLIDIFKKVSYYHRIMAILVEKGLCYPNTFTWIDQAPGSKTRIIFLLKRMRVKGFFSEDPTNEEYQLIAKNTFSLKVGIDTCKGTSVHALAENEDIIPYPEEFE